MNMTNKFFLFAFALAAAITLGSCAKKPTACCDISKTTAAKNEVITFTASCSKNMNTCQWDFGDGTKSTDASTTHAYTASGSYTVQFMAMSKNNSMDQVSKSITIQ